MAAVLSQKLGWIDDHFVARIVQLLKFYNVRKRGGGHQSPPLSPVLFLRLASSTLVSLATRVNLTLTPFLHM